MPADVSNNVVSSQTNNLASDAGSIQLNSYYQAMSGSSIIRDQSMAGIFHKSGNFLQFIGGDGLFNTQADFHFAIGQNVSYSVGGDSQFTCLGQSHIMAQTGGTEIKANRSPQAIAAQTAHQKSLDNVQQAKNDAFKDATKTVPCPVCNQKVTNDRASAFLDRMLGGLGQIWPPYMPFSYATFRKVIGGLVIPMMSIFTNNTFTKSGTCNHPNCDGSHIKVPDYDAANQAAISAIKSDPSIQQNEQAMGSQDTTHAHMADNYVVRAGHGTRSTVSPYVKNVNNSNFPTAHESNGGKLAQVSNGAPSELNYYLTPDHSPVGNIHLDATHSVDITSGGNGTHMVSDGPLEVKVGHVEMSTTHGDLNLFGAGLTQIKGKQVIIDAKDNSGDGGVHVNSDHTLFTGQVSVNGDLSVQGMITHDGTLYAPNLVTKSMSMQTEPSASIQSVGNCSSWNSPPPFNANQQATSQNVFSEALHAIKAGFDAITGELLTVTGLYNVVKRAINSTKLAVPLDNQGIPTGLAWAVNANGYTPLMVAKESIAWVTVPPAGAYGAAGTFPVVFTNTFVDADMLPVYTGPHNHDNISGMHTHQYVGHEGVHCDTTAGFQSQRPSPSNIPTPPRGNGTGTSPADSGSLPISLCLGLGLGRNAGTGARNMAYGIQGDGNGVADGTNYVEAYPNYNADGSLNPPPTLSPFRNC
jgi:hypothetical protein